jgi:hypothetical protein
MESISIPKRSSAECLNERGAIEMGLALEWFGMKCPLFTILRQILIFSKHTQPLTLASRLQESRIEQKEFYEHITFQL